MRGVTPREWPGRRPTRAALQCDASVGDVGRATRALETSKPGRRRLRAEIFGDVQGVGFRYFAQSHARRLGLEGYVRNRYDGAVEVEAEGDASSLERFLDTLCQGPRMARVQDVRVSWMPFKGDLGPFGVRG